MALINEEFERCRKCDGGYFEIRKRVLVVKGSSYDNPVHYQESEIYVCSNPSCREIQYEKKA